MTDHIDDSTTEEEILATVMRDKLRDQRMAACLYNVGRCSGDSHSAECEERWRRRND